MNQENQPTNPKKSNPVIWVIFIIIVVGLGIGVYFLFWQEEETNENTNIVKTNKNINTNVNVNSSQANTNTEQETWELYENSRYGFSINYPATWTLGEPPTNNDGRTFTSPDEDITCRAYGFTNSLLNDEGNPQTLNEYIDWILERETLVERKDTTLAGNSAVRIITESEGKINEAAYALGKETGLGFYCVFENDEDREAFSDDFDEMVESFESSLSLDGE